MKKSCFLNLLGIFIGCISCHAAGSVQPTVDIPQIWTAQQAVAFAIAENPNSSVAIKRIEEAQASAAIAHSSNYPLVNALMRQLLATGWMSNRGRQIAASCLVNDFGIDWRYGAAFFEKHLLDYDVASNYGNWQYLAGVGADPKGGRHFNIEADGLPDFTLPIVNPDHGFNLQVMNKNYVHL